VIFLNPLRQDAGCRLRLVKGSAFTLMLQPAVVNRDDDLYKRKKDYNECDRTDSDVERLEILWWWALREWATSMLIALLGIYSLGIIRCDCIIPIEFPKTQLCYRILFRYQLNTLPRFEPQISSSPAE
jgi:hypothetical protein